jgi:putative transposase
MLAGEMSRHTMFRFCLDPMVEQRQALARYAGAARFAFNQCLRMVKAALTERKTDPRIEVPWTGFDLINAFNGWNKTEDAGRVFAVDTDGQVQTVVTGLVWRREACRQVFEEAAVALTSTLRVPVKPARQTREPKFTPHQRPEPTIA